MVGLTELLVSLDDAKMSSAVNMLEGRDAIQSDLNRLSR